MLRAKVAGGQLKQAELTCSFADCYHALDYTALKITVNKTVFDK
jgi:hypothetical protein